MRFIGGIASERASKKNRAEREAQTNKPKPVVSSASKPGPETLVRRIREQAQGERIKPPRSDGYSREFTITNLGNLSTDSEYDRVVVSEAPELSGLDALQEEDGDVEGAPVPIKREPAPASYEEMAITEAPGLGIGEEDEPPPAREELEIGPPLHNGGSSETSDSISVAVIQAAEEINGGAAPATAEKSQKLRSERPTLPPPAPINEEEGRRTAILPGSPPETSFLVAKPSPSPAGRLTGRSLETVAEDVFGAAGRGERASILSAASQGVSRETMEFGTAPLGRIGFREDSLVKLRVQNLETKIPRRFRPYLEEAMRLIEKNMSGYEPDIEKMIVEKRWKLEREQRLLGSISACSDEVQRVLEKMHNDEAVRRMQARKDGASGMTAGDATKLFAFTILGSHDKKANCELNLFDAYAKAVTFLVLSQHRPRTFMYALGHPEISKPYGQLGGMEALGVLAGLDLPNVSTTRSIPNPIIGLAFRLSKEFSSTTLIGWLQDIVAKYPHKSHIVARFGHFVEQEVRDFQEAVQDAGFGPEMFFDLLNWKGHSGMRSNESLQRLFEKACSTEGRIAVYRDPDDVFDAIEAIVGYMNLLKLTPQAKSGFIEHFLSTYPFTANGGTFYKVFSMCLFTDKEDMEAHPHVVNAFMNDPDERISFRAAEAKRRLEPRETILIEAARAAEEGELDFDIEF